MDMQMVVLELEKFDGKKKKKKSPPHFAKSSSGPDWTFWFMFDRPGLND